MCIPGNARSSEIPLKGKMGRLVVPAWKMETMKKRLRVNEIKYCVDKWCINYNVYGVGSVNNIIKDEWRWVSAGGSKAGDID